MTNAELAILSLIAEQPRYGYEMEQVIAQRGMRDWTEVGFSSIYYLLKKLEKKGFVTGKLEKAERGIARKVFHITDAGYQAWYGALVEALSVPVPCYSPFQLGLSCLPAIPNDQVLDALRQYQEQLKARFDHVRARRDEQAPLPDHVAAMFDLSLTMIEAELGWINRFMTQLETHHE